MRFPYDELTLENRLQSLHIALLRSGGTRRQVFSSEERVVQEFGRDLFEALLCGEARSRYDVSYREARQQGKGLRLKLRIQPPELARLPWEYLYDPRQAEYLCLSRDNPIVRYLELPQPIQPLAVTPPLRILGMIASPRDLPPLDIRHEKQRTETAIQDLQTNGLVNLAWLEGQTWRDLQRAMRGGPWHIFHFIGHGGFDRTADEGVIALADESGLMHPFRATELGRLLSDHHSLRLVLLNACEGARGSERDVFSSTAAILVRRGIPAVLAMQDEITDRAAIEFARAFYEALSDGLPVDAAVTEARKAISLAVTNSVEWGTPVLYTRSAQGVIFQLPEAQRSRQPVPSRLAGLDKDTKQRLERLYTDGLGAFWVEDWDKACRSFQAILDEYPDYPNAAAKLEEAERHKRLNRLYVQAKTAHGAKDWQAAVSVLEMLVAEAANFKDSTELLASVRQQKQLADLYDEARKLSQAEQWRAVVNVFAQISVLDSTSADPEGLLPAAQREVAELERQTELENLYRQAIREMDSRAWQEARRLLATVQKAQPGFRDTERLLSRVDLEIARQEAEQRRQKQIVTLYEQARELARARYWQQALARTQEIQKLDAQFADPEGIVAKAQEAIAREEAEAQRQNESAALYSEAVQLLRAQQYQAALSKWGEVQARDRRYPDRQKVHATATRKLSELARVSSPRRKLPGWVVGALGLLGLVVIVGMTAQVFRLSEGGMPQANATAAAAMVAVEPGATEVPLPTPSALTNTPWPTPLAEIAPLTPSMATSSPWPTPLAMALVDRALTIYDDFNNPAYDGSYNKSQWDVTTNDSLSKIGQQDGALAISTNGYRRDLSLMAKPYLGVRLINPTSIEAKFRLDPNQNGGAGVHYGLAGMGDGGLADKGDAYCQIWSMGGAQSVGCTGDFWGQKVDIISTNVTPGTWHTARIEVDPNTITFTYFIDGQKVREYSPPRVDELKKLFFTLYVHNGCSGDGCVDANSRTVNGYFDYVLIGPVKK